MSERGRFLPGVLLLAALAGFGCQASDVVEADMVVAVDAEPTPGVPAVATPPASGVVALVDEDVLAPITSELLAVATLTFEDTPIGFNFVSSSQDPRRDFCLDEVEREILALRMSTRFERPVPGHGSDASEIMQSLSWVPGSTSLADVFAKSDAIQAECRGVVPDRSLLTELSGFENYVLHGGDDEEAATVAFRWVDEVVVSVALFGFGEQDEAQIASDLVSLGAERLENVRRNGYELEDVPALYFTPPRDPTLEEEVRFLNEAHRTDLDLTATSEPILGGHLVTVELRSLDSKGFVDGFIDIEVEGNAILRSLDISRCGRLEPPYQFCYVGDQPATTVAADPLSVQFEVLTDTTSSRVSVIVTARSDHNRLENDPDPLNNVVTLTLE